MKLYYAPNTRAERTAWLLYELGLDFEVERFRLGDKAMRAPDYLAVNPNGRVPVLDDGGVRISESTAIAQYLVARHGNGSLAPAPESPDFPVYLQWLNFAEGMLMGPVGNYVVETVLLPPERRSEAHAKRAQKLLANLLRSVDAHLEGRDYLAGDFSAADTVTGHGCMVSARIAGDVVADLANLAAYLERVQARPAWQKVVALREG